MPMACGVERPTSRQAAALAAVLVGWSVGLTLLLSPSTTVRRQWPGEPSLLLERLPTEGLATTSLSGLSGFSPSVGGLSPSVGGLSPSVGGLSPSVGGLSPSVGGLQTGGALSMPPPAAAALPAYDPSRPAELLGAAAAGARQPGPHATLLADLAAALERAEREKAALDQRLGVLQPSVGNYNPKDVDALTRAAEQATAREEVSGALPNLLRDLREAVKEQAKSKQELNTKLELQAKLQMRAATRAAELRSLLLHRADANDRIELLFSDVSEAVYTALSAAARGISSEVAKEMTARPVPAEGDPVPRAASDWEGALAELRSAVKAQLMSLSESNSTLARSLEDEVRKRIAAEAVAAKGASATGEAGGDAAQLALKEGVAGPEASANEEAVTASATGETSATQAAAASSSTLADGTGMVADAVGGSPNVGVGVLLDATTAPVVPTSGPCDGKACPAGYVLSVQGTECVCRLVEGGSTPKPSAT